MREGLLVLLGATLTVLLLAAPAAAASLLPGPSSPENDPTPDAPNAVRGLYAIDILSDYRGFDIRVDLDIYEIELPPTGGRSATEIRTVSGPLRELFESSVRDAILAETQRVLPEAKVTLTSLEINYDAPDLDLDPYNPALQVHATLSAQFTPQFFGLPAGARTSAAEIARAFLYSGGTYRLDKQVRVAPGYDIHFVIQAPEPLELDSPAAHATHRVEFDLDNFQGSAPRDLPVDMALRLRPSMVPQNVVDGPLVKAVFIVDDATPLWQQLVPFTGGQYVGQLNLDIDVHSLDASLFNNYPLPPSLRLEHVSADLLRIAIRENLVARDDVTAFFEDLIDRSLREGFGEDIHVAMDWSQLDRSLNEPLGGPDGATVAPLVVHADAVLPFKSNKMLVSSTLGRLVGMTVGSSGSFELANDGMWRSDYTVAYPRNLHVRFHDSLGRFEGHQWGDREGFHVYLGQGESTNVRVDGRSDFDFLVFFAGLVEVGLIAAAVLLARRRLRETRFFRPRPRPI